MPTLKVGITDYEEMKARTVRIVRGTRIGTHTTSR